jgi:hypothetical protein
VFGGGCEIIFAADADAIGDPDCGGREGREPQGSAPRTPVGDPTVQFHQISPDHDDAELRMSGITGQGIHDPLGGAAPGHWFRFPAKVPYRPLHPLTGKIPHEGGHGHPTEESQSKCETGGHEVGRGRG